MNLQEFFSAFLVLFATIDIVGAVPIVDEMMQKNKNVSPLKVSGYSFIIFLAFLFAGKWLIALFGVDLSAFAVAGAVVLFVLACEMIFGIQVFKNDGPNNGSSVVPLIFPLITGAGSFTTLLSLRAEYELVNIILALFANMVVVYLTLKNIKWVEAKLGGGVLYVVRKFLGIILLAMSVRLFAVNISALLGQS